MNPFVYDGPLPADRMIGRRDELADLAARLLDEGRNVRLSGPRRFGKTTVLGALADRAADAGHVSVQVNFMGVLTDADVAARIVRAYEQQLRGPLRSWFSGRLRSSRLRVQAMPGGVGVGVETDPTARRVDLTEMLALPLAVAERSDGRCLVAYDEFQEVARVDPALPGAFRAEIERHGDAVAYCFSGSHPGLMRELFADRRNAFFAQAPEIELGPLDAADLAEGIAARFTVGGREVGDGLDPLLDLAGGHPQRAMLLAHHLFAETAARETADVDAWSRALVRAQREVRDELVFAWERWSGRERGLMSAVADGVAPASARARTDYAISKSGTSTARTLANLEGQGFLLRRPGGAHAIVDPLLRLWLRDGRSWG